MSGPQKNLRLNAAVFMFVCFFVGPVYAGAWLVPKGALWAQYTFKLSEAQNNRTLLQNVELNYGSADEVNLLASVDHTQLDDQPGTFTPRNTAVTSLMLGAKFRLLKGANTLSTQTRLFLPGYYDPDVSPSLGYGDVSLEQRIMLGNYFPLGSPDRPVALYLNSELGCKLRTKNACAGVPLYIAAALQPVKSLFIQADLDCYQAVAGTGGQGDQSFGNAHLGVIWQVMAGNALLKTGQMVNLLLTYGFPVWSRNVTTGPELLFKLQWQR